MAELNGARLKFVEFAEWSIILFSTSAISSGSRVPMNTLIYNSNYN
jgi:hypothetical protein